MMLTGLLVQLDGRSMSLESGRYMETVGWLSTYLRALPRLYAVLTAIQLSSWSTRRATRT